MEKKSNEYTLRNFLELLISSRNLDAEAVNHIVHSTVCELQESGELEHGISMDSAATACSWLEMLINATLSYRKKGKLAYYLATAIALMFMQAGTKDTFLEEIGSYTVDVGLRYAVKRYTVLDRHPDLIQLIYEQYGKFSQDPPRVDAARRVKRLKEVYEAAYQAEVRFHGCSQCILYGLGETITPVDKSLFKAATALSGGMAQCGDGACGGYSGGILYMGTFIGRSFDTFSNDKENQYRSFSMAQRLHDKYVETYGSVLGKGVQEKLFGEFFLLRDARQKAAFGNSGAHEYKCPCVVGTAARWVAEILLDEQLI
ncbi:C-GCAxxG-C-C family protein [Sediminispirochaeta bajacaliforniensis]|uniref:C-GCAxxG-C-C family protein n=1 Tax=Sediminispirochaeta bajacaliforniensis TaxID=148 RepID=UPI00037FD76B|nr:C-GCAxxG-C-C family protein [Sediminispirochaeta bajacaliforniensis]